MFQKKTGLPEDFAAGSTTPPPRPERERERGQAARSRSECPSVAVQLQAVLCDLCPFIPVHNQHSKVSCQQGILLHYYIHHYIYNSILICRTHTHAHTHSCTRDILQLLCFSAVCPWLGASLSPRGPGLVRAGGDGLLQLQVHRSWV